MKNLGGGIAPTGGYIAGNQELIHMVAERLTAPGIGKDLGANFNLNNTFFKGLFMAPNAVKNALKTAVFSAYMLEKLGYSNISPRYDEPRTDIIQTLELKTKDNLLVAGIMRGNKLIVPSGDDFIKAGDSVIIVTTNSFLTSLEDILA